MADADIYMASQDYIDYPQGPNAPTPVRKGQTARAGHPIIERTPHLWVPLTVQYEVEPEPPKAKTSTRKASGD